MGSIGVKSFNLSASINYVNYIRWQTQLLKPHAWFVLVYQARPSLNYTNLVYQARPSLTFLEGERWSSLMCVMPGTGLMPWSYMMCFICLFMNVTVKYEISSVSACSGLCPMMRKHLSRWVSFLYAGEKRRLILRVIILFASDNEVDRVLHLGAVANIQPPLQHGKRHYLAVVCNITFSFSLPPPHSSPSVSLSCITLWGKWFS